MLHLYTQLAFKRPLDRSTLIPSYLTWRQSCVYRLTTRHHTRTSRVRQTRATISAQCTDTTNHAAYLT